MHINERVMLIFSVIEKLLPIVFWLLFLYGFDEPAVAGLTLIAAVIHECGHEFYLLFKRGHTSSLRGSLTGFRISTTAGLSYFEEAMLYFCGPLANFIAAAFSYVFLCFGSEYTMLFSIINIASGLANLLPVEGYDGYGIIRAVLSHLNAGKSAYMLLSAISLTVIFTMCFVSLYLMDRLDSGYWIYAVFITALISKISFSLTKCTANPIRKQDAK